MVCVLGLVLGSLTIPILPDPQVLGITAANLF
jgi:hypothetical protein